MDAKIQNLTIEFSGQHDDFDILKFEIKIQKESVIINNTGKFIEKLQDFINYYEIWEKDNNILQIKK